MRLARSSQIRSCAHFVRVIVMLPGIVPSAYESPSCVNLYADEPLQRGQPESRGKRCHGRHLPEDWKVHSMIGGPTLTLDSAIRRVTHPEAPSLGRTSKSDVATSGMRRHAKWDVDGGGEQGRRRDWRAQNER